MPHQAGHEEEEISEFDIQRQRIREREQRRVQTGREQVKGQFASRGLLSSGAEVKAQERQQLAAAQQATEERRNVLIAEADVRRREREATAQRQFTSGERQAGQEFAGQQAQLGREFTTGERVGGQQFAAEQAGAQRNFLTGERITAQEFAQQQQLSQNAFAANQAALGRQFTTNERGAAETFIASQAVLQQKFQTIFQTAQTEAQKALQTTQLSAAQEAQLKDIALRETLADAQLSQQRDQFNQTLKAAGTQFEKELEISKQNSAINTLTALKNSGFSLGEIAQIVKGLGIENAWAALTGNEAGTGPNTPGDIGLNTPTGLNVTADLTAGLGTTDVTGGGSVFATPIDLGLNIPGT